MCQAPGCRRRIFAERFPQLVRPYGRRTERLDRLLTRMGVLLGAEGSSRLAQDLRVPVSPDTILRLLYRMDVAPAAGLRVVGIDEWAWRKGHRYGTRVCDLETGRPVELLPDVKVITVAQWLQAHPTVQVVSRDQAGTYAGAARVGAPQAIEVADRWHLLKNLGDVAERVVSESSLPPLTPQLQPPSSSYTAPDRPKGQTRKRGERQASRERRQPRYQAIHELYAKTQSIRAVATQLGIDRRTVRKDLNAPECPQPKPKGGRASILDPFRQHLFRASPA